MKFRIGIVGYGSLGKFMVETIAKDQNISKKLEIVWIWNRNKSKLEEDPLVDRKLILENIDDFKSKGIVDLIVEVAHPDLLTNYAKQFLEVSDLMVGSPTGFSNLSLENQVRSITSNHYSYYYYSQQPQTQHDSSSSISNKRQKTNQTRQPTCWLPAGALWGVDDIAKMAQRGTLGSLKITMKKHPESFKLADDVLIARNNSYIEDTQSKGEFIIFDGTVRDLCPKAPNNVNTMATAAMAASNLGFDKVGARIVSDKSLEAHIVQIDLTGPTEGKREEEIFRVNTIRYNPAKQGAVTGTATLASFLSSILKVASSSRSASSSSSSNNDSDNNNNNDQKIGPGGIAFC